MSGWDCSITEQRIRIFVTVLHLVILVTVKYCLTTVPGCKDILQMVQWSTIKFQLITRKISIVCQKIVRIDTFSNEVCQRYLQIYLVFWHFLDGSLRLEGLLPIATLEVDHFFISNRARGDAVRHHTNSVLVWSWNVETLNSTNRTKLMSKFQVFIIDWKILIKFLT